jgi:hypothetical protein
MKLSDNDFDIHAEFVSPPKNLDDVSARALGRLGEAGDFYVYNQSIEVTGVPPTGGEGFRFRLATELTVATLALSTFVRPLVPSGDYDLKRNAAVKRHNVVERPTCVEDSDNRLLGALGYAKDAPLKPTVRLRARDPHFHAVTVHGRSHTIRRDVDVAGTSLIREIWNDETITVTVADDSSGNNVGRH